MRITIILLGCSWMFVLAVIFSVISSFLMNIPMIWSSSVDDQGECIAYGTWSSQSSLQAYTVSLAVYYYVFLLAELIYCYGRIIVQLKNKSAKTVPVNTNDKPNASHHGEVGSRSQANVIKAMIIISITYALSSFLNNFGYVAWSFDPNTVLDNYPQYYINVGTYFLNVWVDPFIYALGNKEVRNRLIDYFHRIKPGQSSGTSDTE